MFLRLSFQISVFFVQVQKSLEIGLFNSSLLLDVLRKSMAIDFTRIVIVVLLEVVTNFVVVVFVVA